MGNVPSQFSLCPFIGRRRAAAAAQEGLLKDNPDDWLALVASLDALLACEAASLPAPAGAAASPVPQLPELLERCGSLCFVLRNAHRTCA